MSYLPRHRPSIVATPEAAASIDSFQSNLGRFLDGKVPEASFLEYRLRHGVYGQRQDGVHMMRSKLPLGLLDPEQLDAFADLTEAYAAGIAHLTTRQDIQVHFVPLSSTPELMRVLARAKMTSREACGNVVRNVCASEVAGVEPGEAFDVTPYGMALAAFLLQHPDGQSLGRKFKVSLAGSFDPRFNLAAIHDLGATAVLRDGQRGFHVRVGGGLGAVPHEAPVLTEFLPVDELLPLAQVLLRLFARHGEKEKRARARLKFLVARWGIERFRAEVAAERARLEPDPRWTQFDLETWTDAPLHGPATQEPSPRDEADARWLATNVSPQKQAGYGAVRVRVPQGDLTPTQLRGVAALLREHAGNTLRIAPDHSLLIRFVPRDRLLLLRDGLAALGLARPGAGGIADPVTCPGADSCKLGITSPRTLARSMAGSLDRLAQTPALADLTVKISGCPNSCAQHHVADIGLFGAARTVHGVTAPHFTLLLGGTAGGLGPGQRTGDGFGQIVVKLPAGRVEEAFGRITDHFLAHRDGDEAFADFARRVGRPRWKELLADLCELPSPTEAPDLYREWGRDERFQVVRGIGECAGAVVLGSDLWMVEADRGLDAAVDAFEDAAPADDVQRLAVAAMDDAARALLSTVGEVRERALVDDFRVAFYETGRIFEGVGHHYLAAKTEGAVAGDRVRRLVTEASLFVEEAHSILGRLRNSDSAPQALGRVS